MWLEDSVAKDDRSVAVETGEAHDGVYKCIYYVVKEALMRKDRI